jgi:KDO2-lipid IV(A) lauroyltransferase
MAYWGFLVFYGIAKALAILPLKVLYLLSDFLYYVIYYVVKYRRKVVYENLRNAFPEKNEKEIKLIAKKFYRHFCDNLVEILKLFHMPAEEMKQRMKCKNPEMLQEAYDKGQHVMIATAHFNNWEWGSALSMVLPHTFVSIYRPLKNEYFDELMIKLRTQFGGEVLPMRRTARVVAQYVKEKKLSLFVFIADQSPYGTEIQYWTDFMNQDTPVNLGVEKLAKAAKQPVCFAKNIRVKRGYYEIEVVKLCEDASLLPEYEVTNMHVRELEKAIREHPECWLWTHRRWKHKREKRD